MYFIESIHKYYKNFPDENFKYISASSVAKRYSQEFDDVFWSLYKAYEFLLYKTDVDPTLHIDDYLLNKPKEPKDYFKPYKKGYIGTDYRLFKHLRMYADENEVKKIQSYILKSWDEKNKNSLIKGGKYHSNEEFNALQEDFMINPFTGNKLPVIQCNEFINQDLKRLVVDLKDLKPGFYTELIVYSGMLLGQIDQLWVEEFNGNIVFWIVDHKTNEKMNMNNPFQKMKYPINHFDDCVSGDTKLITKTGVIRIKDSVNRSIEIWNGNAWSLVTPFPTKKNTEIYRVMFDDGSYLDVTDNHKFLIKYRLDREFEEQSTLDIINKLNTTKWLPRVPNSNIKYFDGFKEDNAYDYGFILGDGTVDSKYIRAGLYNEDKKIKFYSKPRITTGYTWYATFKLNVDFTKSLKYDKGLPDIIFSWDRESILKFLSGWIDADGANQHKSIRLYGLEDKLRDAQLLLTKCGIKSSIKLVQKSGTRTNLSIRKNDLYYLHISKTSDLYCQRVKCTSIKESLKKHKWQFIKSITKLTEKQDSYCLTEKENGTCVFNNVLTKQCNYNHYRIQLGVYSYILEEYGYTCMGNRLMHSMYDEVTDSWEIENYDFDYIRHEMNEIVMDITINI